MSYWRAERERSNEHQQIIYAQNENTTFHSVLSLFFYNFYIVHTSQQTLIETEYNKSLENTLKNFQTLYLQAILLLIAFDSFFYVFFVLSLQTLQLKRVICMSFVGFHKRLLMMKMCMQTTRKQRQSNLQQVCSVQQSHLEMGRHCWVIHVLHILFFCALLQNDTFN